MSPRPLHATPVVIRSRSLRLRELPCPTGGYVNIPSTPFPATRNARPPSWTSLLPPAMLFSSTPGYLLGKYLLPMWPAGCVDHGRMAGPFCPAPCLETNWAKSSRHQHALAVRPAPSARAAGLATRWLLQPGLAHSAAGRPCDRRRGQPVDDELERIRRR